MGRKYKKDKRSLKSRKADSSSSYWLKRADALWSEYIRREGVCEVCGATENLNAHHLIPWENAETRHNPNNGISLCPRCHKWNNILSAHQGTIMFADWLRINKPDKYNWVIYKSQTMAEDVARDYRAAYETLNKLYDSYKRGLENE